MQARFVADHVGEVKVTVKVDEVPGEITILNNEMSTYVNVRKEGVNVLWVEGRRREQTVSVFNQALSNNPRLSITYDLRTTDAALSPEQWRYSRPPKRHSTWWSSATLAPGGLPGAMPPFSSASLKR